MIIDNENIFSKDQEITVTTASNNIIDLGNNDSLIQEITNNGILISILITTAFVGGLEIYVIFQTSDSEDFSDYTDLVYSDSLTIDMLEETGRQFCIDFFPVNIRRYLRLYYVVSGTMSAVAIHASLILDSQLSNKIFINPVFLSTHLMEKVITDDGTFIILE